MDQLPENVVQIDALRITRAVGKRCQCTRRYKRYTVDPDNREVTCSDCGARVDPFEAILNVAEGKTALQEQTRALLDQRQALEQWKPHRVAMKRLDEHFGYRFYADMIPCCPHCGRGIEYTELGSGTWVSRAYDQRRRQRAGEPGANHAQPE